jgi:hypothetical protein
VGSEGDGVAPGPAVLARQYPVFMERAKIDRRLGSDDSSGEGTITLPRPRLWIGAILAIAWVTAAVLLGAPSDSWLVRYGVAMSVVLFVSWFVRYRWTGHSIDTYFGPLRIRQQPIEPVVLWVRLRGGGSVVLASADDVSFESPPFFPKGWGRRLRKDGHAVVSPPWLIPVERWSEVLAVPLRDYLQRNLESRV